MPAKYTSQVILRHDTSASWTTNNPVLATGEVGLEVGASTTPGIRIGDGTSKFDALPKIQLMTEDQFKAHLETNKSIIQGYITIPETSKITQDEFNSHVSGASTQLQTTLDTWVSGKITAAVGAINTDVMTTDEYNNLATALGITLA